MLYALKNILSARPIDYVTGPCDGILFATLTLYHHSKMVLGSFNNDFDIAIEFSTYHTSINNPRQLSCHNHAL